MSRPFYCYKITNLINGKIYIGKAVDVDERWRKHKVAAKRQDPNDYSYLHRAMNSYGIDNFKIEILDEFSTEEESLAAEKQLIKLFGSLNRDVGYNLTEGGEGSSGFKHTPESRQKMSQTKKDMNLVGENNPFYGQHHSLESKQKMSDTHIEYFKVNEHPFTGKNHTDESRALMSSSAMGREIGPETRDKISAALKGDARCITNAKLSESDIIEIKKLLDANIPGSKIAETFHVSRPTISLIKTGKIWGHVK